MVTTRAFVVPYHRYSRCTSQTRAVVMPSRSGHSRCNSIINASRYRYFALSAESTSSASAINDTDITESTTDDTSTNTNTKQQHTITWRSTSGKDDITFKVQDGELLRTATLRRGLVSPHNGNARLVNCRGLGTCGTCAVEIESALADACAPVDPSERNNVETLRLNFPPHGGSKDQSPNLRLACQVAVRGDLVVTKRAGFWGQDDTEMVDPSSAKTYFGELEYILDGRSPDNKG